MDGLHPQAYAAFQASRDLQAVIRKVSDSESLVGLDAKQNSTRKPKFSRELSTGIRLMTPIKPMLAEACRSAAHALSKVEPGGHLLAEIKYDGERVQVHKDGNKFAFFSRSLKPVPTNKRTSFQDANVCVFVFDCLYLNGKSLVEKPISHRRAVLEQYFTEVPHRVLLSEKHIIENVASLNKLMARVFSENLEGVVLKPTHFVVVVGWLICSYVSSLPRNLLKAGLMSVFLMGAYDPAKKQFVTVTKCGNGFTDEMLQNLQKTLKVKRITKSEVPAWLDVAKSLIPDFVVNDPKAAPVWEITGAEFSRASTHTANLSGDQTLGISIRFPRFTKARPDKSWKQATNVIELERLVQESGKRSDWLNLLNEASSSSPVKAMTSKRMATSEFSTSDQHIKLTRTSVEKQSRHLSSLFSEMIVYVPEEAKFEKSNLEKTLRLLIAGGAELSGSVSANFTTFLNSKEPTHLLIPAGYNMVL
ncbi:hypothetical protein PHET_05262 [Paragonimus heterotremus]|uniref:ATP-dependent DNA ligase family profile domain-containing protein n=1 Tax=Paragonimus heterotremus TaxID=100268 RepID=A0A8J4SY89_9TREM|nr:hypothetical protein PHET_05262 [Paragonimus heterotremus]